MLDNIFSVKNEYTGIDKFKIVNIMGNKIKFKVKRPKLQQEQENTYGREFMEIFRDVSPYTMISMDAAYANYCAVNYISDNNINGDIVECGVWRGGSIMLMIKTLQKRGNTSRKIYLFDTFEGMSEPTIEDTSINSNKTAIETMEEEKKKKEKNPNRDFWCEASLEVVKKNLESTNYPSENIIYVKGKVEDTLEQYSKTMSNLAIMRLDTDFYESSKTEMEYLYPLLEKRGVMMFDDYYFWNGQRKATDEYFSKINQKPILWKVAGTAVSIKE